MGRLTGVVSSVVVCALLAITVSAADLKKNTADAEGRRRTAENGAKTIKAKSQAGDLRTQYAEAAAANNDWLKVTTDAIKQGAVSDAIQGAADKAATTFVKWVAARNAALGEPVLAGSMATAIQTQTKQNLIDIATEAVRATKGNDKKKADAATDLARLQWKSWGEL